MVRDWGPHTTREQEGRSRADSGLFCSLEGQLRLSFRNSFARRAFYPHPPDPLTLPRFKTTVAAALTLCLARAATAELPTPLSRFSSLPCLAPIIRAVDPDAPKNIGEALLLPPYRSIDRLEGIGTATFPLTDVSPESQSAFDKGLTLLHQFDDHAAERCFRDAASRAPDHPLPYLGLALANERSPGRASIYIDYAEHLAGRMPDLSKREQQWVNIYHRYLSDEPNAARDDTARRRARIGDLEDLAYDYPDDLEARAFLLRELVLDEHRAAIPVGSHYAVDALAMSLLADNPKHPAANYRPLLWLRDRPQRAARFALAAPRVAPQSPGAWRTAGEAFAASGDFRRAIVAGDAAARLDLARLSADLPMPDEHPAAVSGIAAHIETLISCGASTAAIDLARHLITLPRTAYLDPKRDTLADAQRGAFMTGRRLLASALMRAGRWKSLKHECTAENGQLLATESWTDRTHTLYWRAIAEWHLDRHEAASATGKELELLFRSFLSKGTTLEVEKEISETIKSLRAYATLFQAPKPKRPTRDLKHISAPQLARLLAEHGSPDVALEVSGEHLVNHPSQPEAIATHCALLASSGFIDKALPLFDTTFRRNASLADRGHVLFSEPLSPLVKKLGLRGNWTLPAEKNTSTPPFPEIATLGDRWSPPLAPAFDLARPEGGTLNSETLRGRPTVVIFFVGVGCAFCVEQLKIFQPHAEAFTAAGIPIHTVSTDSLEALQTTLSAAAESPPDAPAFPFPILADPSLETFGAYRCFDHFNEKALHGIYLISPDGHILWNNISHEPFLHPEFLLSEATRLLRLWPSGQP